MGYIGQRRRTGLHRILIPEGIIRSSFIPSLELFLRRGVRVPGPLFSFFTKHTFPRDEFKAEHADILEL